MATQEKQGKTPLSQDKERGRWLKLHCVERRVGLKKSRIYELMAEGKFPLPAKPGGYHNVWVESEIDAWINKVLANREYTFVAGR